MDFLTKCALLVAFALPVACAPEVFTGSYYCGPERSCPPGQVCDEPLFVCDNPTLAREFECPEGSEDSEPDDSVAEALDLGTTKCGESVTTALPGCIDDADDVDVYSFVHNTDCAAADPHFELTLSYAYAFTALDFDVVDSAGTVVENASSCEGPGGFTGQQVICIEIPNVTDTYFVRVSMSDSTEDCNGECRYNLYRLSINLVPF
jgi:hypothetical protein